MAALQQDGRASWADLGTALGLSAPAAAERVRKLTGNGTIRGFAAVLDPGAAGFPVLAFVAVTLTSQGSRAAFLNAVRRHELIQECHHVAGDEDYLLKVRCRDTEALERLLTQELKAHDGVVRTRTTVVLSTAKETALPPLPLPSEEARDGGARPRKAPGRGAPRKEAP